MADKNKIEIILSAVDTGITAAFGRVNKAIAAAEQGSKSYGSAMSALQSPIRALSSTLAQLGAAFGAVFATQKYVQVAEEYSGIDARLKLVTGSSEELKKVQGDLYELSQKTGTGYQENAATYTKLAAALKGSGASSKELLGINEAVSKSLVVAGASAAEARSFLLQFGQAMGSGVLQGDELRAMLESNSYFAQQLAAALKTDIAGLRQMGSAGKLTTEIIREAVPKMLQQINTDFEKMPLTIGRAMTMLENAFGKIVNGSNAAGGATGKIAGEIKNFVTYLENNSREIEAFVIQLISMTTSLVKTAWEYRNFITTFALSGLAVSAIATITTAVKGLSAAINLLPIAGAASFKLLGSGLAGFGIGTILYDQSDLVKKAGNLIAETLTGLGLVAKKAWRLISGGDTGEVDREIQESKRIYAELYNEIGNGAKKTAETQKQASRGVTTTAAEENTKTLNSAKAAYEKQKVAFAAALGEMKKQYQGYAAEIKRLQGEIVSEEMSLDQQLRDMQRQSMSAPDAWKDKKKQAMEYMAVAKAAGEAAKFALQNGDTAGANDLFKTQAEYAKMAKEQYSGLATEVKDGDKVIVSQEQAIKDAMAGVKTAGEANIAAMKGMQESANQAMNALTEKSGFQDLSKGMDSAEEKWLKNWQNMQAGAIKDIEAVEDRLLAIKDREVTVWINEKVKKAVGGIVGKYARGGQLPGYGGGDRISALLEAGEFVIRKEAVAKFGSGFFSFLNSLRVPNFAMLSAGGPTASASPPLAAGATYNITLNHQGGSSQGSAKDMAKVILGELQKLHRGRS